MPQKTTGAAAELMYNGGDHYHAIVAIGCWEGVAMRPNAYYPDEDSTEEMPTVKVRAIPVTPPPAPPMPPAAPQEVIVPKVVEIIPPPPQPRQEPGLAWQYCHIHLYVRRHTQQNALTHYPFYFALTVSYFDPQEVTTEQITEETDDAAKPGYTWGRLHGVLGMAEWELVMDYRDSETDKDVVQLGAYFKRPLREDRLIDDPRLLSLL